MFHGRVASIEPYIPLISDHAGRPVTFEVSSYWKGEFDGPTIVLRSWRSSIDYEFEAGGASTSCTRAGGTRIVRGPAAVPST